ncbi:MAG: hypothetical protein SFV15_26905 [Polyangiaceae bacterium]|nr:hypothetical protein [Polyangiaceae bacterium]
MLRTLGRVSSGRGIAVRMSMVARVLGGLSLLASGCSSAAEQRAIEPSPSAGGTYMEAGGARPLVPAMGGSPGSSPAFGGRGSGGPPSSAALGGQPSASGGAPQMVGGSTGGGGASSGGSSLGGSPSSGGAASTPPSEFTCTLVQGILATAEWYNEGFEKADGQSWGVTDSRWELRGVHEGMVELWADPNDPIWSEPITSPCASSASNPDRVIFVGLNWDYKTVEEWKPPLEKVVANLKAKFSNLRQVELATFVRAPGNMGCPNEDTNRLTISPGQDQAIAELAASSQGFVLASPRFEAKACSDYNLPPHPSPEAAPIWAKMIADYYEPAR